MRVPLARIHSGVEVNNLRDYGRKQSGLDQVCGKGNRREYVKRQEEIQNRCEVSGLGDDSMEATRVHWYRENESKAG